MKTVVALSAAFGPAMLLAFAITQYRPFLADQRLQDLAWLRRASPSEMRTTAHEALAFRFGDPHEAFGVLQIHGDRSSIVVLQTAMARQPVGPAVDCTWIHGQRALERVLKLPP